MRGRHAGARLVAVRAGRAIMRGLHAGLAGLTWAELTWVRLTWARLTGAGLTCARLCLAGPSLPRLVLGT